MRQPDLAESSKLPASRDCFDGDHGFEDLGLAAGRSQREKRRSYKDFLREEEEIAAQVRNSSKKKLKLQDTELCFLGTDVHRKKRKRSPDDSHYGDISSLESAQKKKKRSSSQAADTAMDLLKAITSPLAAGAHPPRKAGEKSSGSSGHGQPKKKNVSAYQVFCKEYRATIVADHPGIDFGELSKKLAEVWKQLPEKDKLIWKQKAQYLQHKQNKAEATTVKRKVSASEGSVKVKAPSTGVLLPQKKSPPTTVLLPTSPSRAPETEPIDVAAHLQLLGESLSLIGHRLQETEGMVAVSGSLSVLLDSIICALGPLACLTTQLPELNGCPKQVLSNTLDNVAYIMPGL
ncbi:HMG domain-containing protein 4 [Heterocephalus glaber]|uniref:High mobility group protein 2-like 1 n=1 Tax=Heterocephalus glaber TaxID=10181 RepID=G5BPE8_HETGA|nr:HMG domain-containing protein 4 [Heterocephalus glaber]